MTLAVLVPITWLPFLFALAAIFWVVEKVSAHRKRQAALRSAMQPVRRETERNVDQ